MVPQRYTLVSYLPPWLVRSAFQRNEHPCVQVDFVLSLHLLSCFCRAFDTPPPPLSRPAIFLWRQDHRGSIAWVAEAFGAEWGFVDAVWSFATSFLDNALYPLIIADFLGFSGLVRWIFVYGSISMLTWAVYRGSAVRGRGVGVPRLSSELSCGEFSADWCCCLWCFCWRLGCAL